MDNISSKNNVEGPRFQDSKVQYVGSQIEKAKDSLGNFYFIHAKCSDSMKKKMSWISHRIFSVRNVTLFSNS